jgi:hypothetical protein
MFRAGSDWSALHLVSLEQTDPESNLDLRDSAVHGPRAR